MKTIKDTILYKKLYNGYSSDDDLAKKLVLMVETLCGEAVNRMKKSMMLHQQFTLHDEVHLFRVTEIMAKILGEEMINALNPIEITILILSAYYHDIGMIMDDDDIAKLILSDDFILHKKNWIITHPNYKEAASRLRNSDENTQTFKNSLRVIEELDKAILTEYIRFNHASYSNIYITKKVSENTSWKIGEYSIAPIVAKICESHCMDIKKINEDNGFYVDENISSYKINTVYIAIILRLADILDFDRERTPDSIYKTIHFANDVSLIEWEKHRSIEGWEISDERIRFTAKCIHPIYQRAVLTFMDWIDEELNRCHNAIIDFPSSASKYKLNIPRLSDRSRIGPLGNMYIYHDLEFSLSRDEIVKLLMTDELYSSSALCVRELLQNSLDALRHRKARLKYDLGTDWNDGKVEFTHSLDEYGREIVICTDNGMGMDEDIICNFFTKAGRSYYKSPIFGQEKNMLKLKNIEFEPCSQFGIGIMSCFMLGDLINIKTRRDYGNGKPHGKPLHIEIRGLNGIITIRKGEDNQPIGTTISITGRNKPECLDKWGDNVRLIPTLEGYALNCEFPIMAKCSIEELEASIEIPAGDKVKKHKTFREIKLA